MRHYSIPLHGTYFLDKLGPQNNNGVTKARDGVNAVYQAKYGLFTCYGAHVHVGQANFDTLLISQWEPKESQQVNMWYTAIASAIKGGHISLPDLEQFRIRYPRGLNEKRVQASRIAVQGG
jgi:hypothetical protein